MTLIALIAYFEALNALAAIQLNFKRLVLIYWFTRSARGSRGRQLPLPYAYAYAILAVKTGAGRERRAFG